MDKYTLKHAIIAVLIGCAVTLITDLSHALIGWLQHYNSEILGGTAGTAAYAVQRIRQWI